METMIETAPHLDLSVAEVETLLGKELEVYHALYSPLFQRQEQREHGRKYLEGLMSQLPNKSVESMVLHLEDGAENQVRARQQFIGAGAWQDEPILHTHWQEVERDLGASDAVLILDSSGFPKQGDKSVGVGRQWCGELGKVDNCQVGVFLGYASRRGYTLVHRALYMPEDWFTESYAQKRQQCGVPEDLPFQTKPELGLEMVKAVHEAGTLPYRWLTCDEEFGKNPAFLDAVAAYVDYFAEVPHDTRVWRQRPQTEVPEWSGHGRKPTKEQLCADEPAPQTVVQIAEVLPEEQWSRHLIQEGTKGPIVADCAAVRVVAVRDALPGPDVWLVCRRNGDELKCFLSSAPAQTPFETLVWLTGMRWPVERCFEEGKQELGMGDYQMRSWTGWHHHMTLCLLAHFLLVRLQIRLGDKAPDLTLPQAVLLLQAILPKPDFDAQLALNIVRYRQRRNAAATRSHRKRRSSDRTDELSL